MTDNQQTEYHIVTAIQPEHQVYLVQDNSTRRLYIQKTMDVYNADVFRALMDTPVPGIPSVRSMTENDGHLTVIEEYISGEPLSELIQSASLSPDHIRHILLDLCKILSYLHTMKPPIIHRDIKPSNIMILPDGHAMLLDFNAAKFACDESRDTVLLGTQGYAAPEQYGFGASTPATDIYALGVVLREMTNSLPVRISDFDTIIRTCTQLDPSRRYASADELAEALKDTSVPASVPGASSHRLPGFRSGVLWKEITALFGYTAWAGIALNIEPASVRGTADLWANRLALLALGICIILLLFNYRGIQSRLPLCRSKNRLVRALGVAGFSMLTCFFFAMVAVLLESVIP